jgi:hypothetical protein
LALGADEENVAAVGDGVFEERAGLREGFVGFAQVDDRNTLTVVENEGLGARIPAFGLVSEVNACVEQVFGRDAEAHVDLMCLAKHRSAEGPPCDRSGWFLVLTFML